MDEGNTRIFFRVTRHAIPEDRSGDIIVFDHNGEEKSRLRITQRGLYALDSVQPKITQLAAGETRGSFQVVADPRCQWTVKVISGDDWLSISGDLRGEGPGKVEFAAQAPPANMPSPQRYARIEVRAPGSDPVVHTVEQARR